MAKTNRQYWIERAQHRELISYTNGLDVTAFLTNEYKKCAARTRKDINDFYSRYANDYGLTYEQAVREMSRPELMEWRGTVEDYINEIRNEKNPQVRERLMREYDARSYNSRISRLDGLCGNIQMNVDRLYSRAVNQLSDFLGEEFKGSYYRTMYDLQTVNGFSSNFSTINAELVEKTLAYPWSGANFSDRLWKNKNVLIDTIRETLTQGMIRGDSIRDMTKAIAEKLGSSLKNAERVVRTETSHIHNTAEIEAYKAGGYEEYEFMASFGERTCPTCGGMDGKRFKLSDKADGLNFPPLHPNCRCTTVPYFDDFNEGEERFARGEDGKGYYVPSDMKYSEWKERFVEGGNKSGIVNSLEKDVEKSLDKTVESGIIEARVLAQKKEFNVLDFEELVDTQSVEDLKKFASDKLGISHIVGVDRLKNGNVAQRLLSAIDELSNQYDKRFSRISLVDYGSHKTAAETLGNELRLNIQYLNRPGALKAILDEWEMEGYIPKACNEIEYVARHEFYHLLTQEAIDVPNSQILVLLRRAFKKGYTPISKNGVNDCYEEIADLLSAKKLTKAQKQLKDQIVKLVKG